MAGISSRLRKNAASLVERLELENPGRVYDPLQFLLEFMVCESQPWELRLEAAKSARKAVHPDLQTTQITGKDEGPIAIHAIMAKILLDPEQAAAAEKLSLNMNDSGSIENAPHRVSVPSATLPSGNPQSI